jgi:hypothetical protein
MYADNARLGALGSFLGLPREAFSDFSAALRWRTSQISLMGSSEEETE